MITPPLAELIVRAPTAASTVRYPPDDHAAVR
jgi:hypothetical protein